MDKPLTNTKFLELLQVKENYVSIVVSASTWYLHLRTSDEILYFCILFSEYLEFSWYGLHEDTSFSLTEVDIYGWKKTKQLIKSRYDKRCDFCTTVWLFHDWSTPLKPDSYV